jgi:uncharacterized membrane protein
MAGNRRVVVGVFPRRTEAEQALAALRDAGFAGQDVSLLTQNPDAVVAPDRDPSAAEGAAAGAFAGGLTGAFAGWIIGAGSLLIPGFGPFLAAGAIATALTGAALGAGIGAIGGALTGMGIPEEEARWYEQQVQAGGTLVTVDAANRADEAEEILRRHGGRDVRMRDAERVGYGVAGGSSSMDVPEGDRTDRETASVLPVDSAGRNDNIDRGLGGADA